jgi:hypothetical protein
VSAAEAQIVQLAAYAASRAAPLGACGQVNCSGRSGET